MLVETPRPVAPAVVALDAFDPSPSPDGRRMVVIRVVDGREQLFIMDLDGAHPRQITTDPYDHEDPAWSPDGKRLAFVSKAGGGEAIVVSKIDGADRRIVSAKGRRAIHPTWSHDGASLFYCTDDDLAPPRKNDSDIVRYDFRGGQTHVLITGGVNTYPNLSPDGARLAFRRMVDGVNSEVFIADADGAHARNITNNAAFDGWPAWSPDGRWIAFASNRAGAYKIYIMRPDGSKAALVADTTGRATAPRWSTDGRHILFPVCRRGGPEDGCRILAAPAPKAG